ncbi:MAG: CDP-alcohol phosphatidyltransferase family protein [Elusimicrobiota bacterium]|jgi:phosphatidylglycerophosphate synthase
MNNIPPSPNPFAKETDGFFARHFDRRLSGAISRYLLKTPVTPNQITVGVTLLGVVAGYFMAQIGYTAKVIGSALFLLTSILDGCDGEVARAKKMTSKLGGWLDLWGDNVVHVAVFYGVGLGLFRDSNHPIYLLLGKAAVIGTILSASLASYQTYRKTRNRTIQPEKGFFTSVAGDEAAVRSVPAWEKRLVAVSDALARRDFVYGVLFLALIAHLEWFLWPCAVGVNVYAAVLLLLIIVS